MDPLHSAVGLGGHWATSEWITKLCLGLQKEHSDPPFRSAYYESRQRQIASDPNV